MRRSALSGMRGRHAAPRRSLARWGLFAVAVLAGLAMAAALSSSARAGGTIDASITGPTNSGSACVLQIANDTFSVADTALTSIPTNCSSVTLPVGSSNFASLSATGLALDTASTTTSPVMTLSGTTTVFGQSADVLIVGQWPDTTSATPVFSVIVKFTSINLSSLVSGSSSSLDVPLGSAWIATTNASSTTSVDPSTLATSAQSFLTSTMAIAPSGVTLRADPATTGPVATALSTMGIDPSATELNGTLTGSLSGFSWSSPPTASAAFDVTASVTLSGAPSTSWIDFNTAQTLEITGSSAGDWSVVVTGNATLTIGGSSTTASASVSLVGSGTSVQLDLSVQLGTLSDAFGQSWLTLDSAQVTATISTTSFTGSFSASADIGSPATTFTVNASIDSSSGLSLSLSAAGPLDAMGIAGDLGLTWPNVTGMPDPSVTNLVIDLEITPKGDVTVAFTGAGSILVNGQHVTVDLLVRADSATKSLVVAARLPGGQSLNALLGLSGSTDLTLPELSLVFSNTGLTADSSTLDPATLAYFSPILCDGSTPCSFNLDIAQGVGVEASVTLPTSLTDLLTKVGITTSGPLVIDGQIPLFGNTAASLAVHLPTVFPNSPPFARIAVSLDLAVSKTSVSFSLVGDMTIVVPGSTSGAGSCPDGVTAPSGDTCIDLNVQATITAGTSGLSVDISAQLSATTGWTLNDPSWLTIYNLAVDVGVSTGETGAGVQVGLSGTVKVGSKDLTVAVALKVTANPPWIEPLGFTIASNSGISISDLTSFYQTVTGQSISPSALPDVGLRNLYLSISTITNPTLCLQQGVYIRADLVINSGNNAISPDATPPCMPSAPSGQDATSACQADSQCLATISLSVDPSVPSISGGGLVKGFSAGPLIMDDTSLDFTLSPSEVQVDISGGGKLLDPVKYATEGTSAPTWASGSLTLGVGSDHLLLDGAVSVGQLSGHVHATGALNLSDPGFNLTDWFNQVQQFFTNAGTQINTAMTTVSNTAQQWNATYIAPTANAVFGAINGAFGAATTTSQEQQFADLLSVYNNVASVINTINSGFDSIGLSKYDISLNSVISEALHGFSFGGWQICVGKCYTVIPSFNVPGICSYDSAIWSEPVCTQPFSDFIASAQSTFADPSVQTSITGAGLNMPTGASDGSVVTRIYTLDPPAPSQVTCAMATANYSTGTESSTSVTVNSLGHDVTFTQPNPTELGNSANNATNTQNMSQDTFNGLYSGTNSGSCTTPTSFTAVPPITLSLDHSWIYEGASVTASGYVEDSSVSQVSINWGDGSSSTVTVNAGQYSANHVYADEGGTTGSSTFTVTTSAVSNPSLASATQSLSVLDAPITLGTFNVAPSPVNIMSSVTASGSVTNLETAENTTTTITWGDGTSSVVTVNPDGTFSATHVYQQLTPVGQPSQDETVQATVTEDDATSAVTTAKLTLNDVAPDNTWTSLTSGQPIVDGTIFTHVGVPLAFSGGGTSITPQTALEYTLAWGDGTSSTVTVAAPSGPAVSGNYPYDWPASSLTHTYQSACYNPMTTSVVDEDTMTGPSVNTPIIVTAPLGAAKQGAGYWLSEMATALQGPNGTLSAEQLGCYLSIAHYLSPSLPTGLAEASAVLSPHFAKLSALQIANAKLERDLLTSLLNFANGTWDWTQPVTPSAIPYNQLVAAANSALAGSSVASIDTARLALTPLS
jgi:hypothetical protein